MAHVFVNGGVVVAVIEEVLEGGPFATVTVELCKTTDDVALGATAVLLWP